MYKYVMVVAVPTDEIDKYHFGSEWKRVDNMFTMEFYVHNNPERELKHVIRDLMPFVSKDSRYLLIHQALWRIIDTAYSADATDDYGAIAMIERFNENETVAMKLASKSYGIR